MSNYKLGVIPSSPDIRDYHITKLVPKLNVFPEAFTVPLNGVVAHNQHDVGACVAFSLTVIKEVQEFKEKGTYTHFSPLYIYANRAAEDNQEPGMYPREALKRLAEYGVCEEYLLPELVEVPEAYNVFAQKATPEIMEAAKKNKIAAYARLVTQDEIKSALMQIGPVTFAIPVFSNFYYPNAEGIIQAPGGQIEGYHEMTIVGWDNSKGWLVLNSWGTGWGKDGYCWYNYQYPITEAWSVTDYIAPNPNPDNKFYKVIYGKFRTRWLANYIMRKITRLGYKPFLVKNEKSYSIQIGAFTNEMDALQLQSGLKIYGYRTEVIYE